MDRNVYRYQFDQALDLADVEATVTLSVLATESLHGESRVRLEAHYRFEEASRSCVIAATSQVGIDLNRLFLGFMTREFGTDSFRVERVAAAEEPVTTTMK
jgi:hypothetical protein